MTLAIALPFLGAMTVFLLLMVHYYRRSVAAKNSALILARVMPNLAVNDQLYARAVSPERLATNVRLQGMLMGTPMLSSAAGLLEASGARTTVAEMLVMMVASGGGSAMLASVMGCSTPASGFLGLMCIALPIIYFQRKRAQRIVAFEAQLPQMMEMLTLYLRTGRSLPQAFTAVAEEIPAPAAEELAICAEEYRLGRPLPIALKGLAQKYPESLGLKLFAIAISVLGQTGGNLVDVLERIKRTLDSSITYVLKLRALTGEARTSATILGALPGVFMGITALGNAEYFNSFFSTSMGLVLLSMFCVFWVAGILWLRIIMSSRL